MLTRLDLRSRPDVFADPRRIAGHLPRPQTEAGATALPAVREILAAVRADGDAAVRRFTERFDGVDVADPRVPRDVCEAALAAAPEALRAALVAAHDSVVAFHRTQVHAAHVHERAGITVRSVAVPVDRAGVYVPGGKAIYPSTVLMTAGPAKVAGVPEVVLCAPPDPATGRPAALTLAAAAVVGVDEVWAIGGAQAIGAMAYGTATLASCDVIVGPGNAYVALAKREVAGEGLVGVPSSFAGPSEVVVVADDSTDARLAAIDVILQAEHGPDGLAWLVTWSPAAADAIGAAMTELVAVSPRRAVIEANLTTNGFAVVVDGPAEAMAVVNAIAPEHLELMTSDPDALVPLVRHAGAVFTGPWAPASVGDYVAGPSHTLPTFGTARFGEALTVADFTKHVHVITCGPDAVRAWAPHVIALADAEGLPAHADSIRLRLDALSRLAAETAASTPGAVR